jgi:hypothetical protein
MRPTGRALPMLNDAIMSVSQSRRAPLFPLITAGPDRILVTSSCGVNSPELSKPPRFGRRAE